MCVRVCLCVCFFKNNKVNVATMRALCAQLPKNLKQVDIFNFYRDNKLRRPTGITNRFTSLAII